jgi:hypothetical protein
LHFECNELNGTANTGIYITTDGASPNQGSTQISTGNKFSLTARNYDIYSSSKVISYFSYRKEESPPVIYNNNISIFKSETVNTCPSHFGTNISGIQTLSAFDTQISAKTNALDSITDGGNTEQLVDVITTSEPDEALLLRNKLLTESPDLSDDAMKSAAEVEDVLPALMLTQVLEKNPQAAKSNVVKTALDSRQNPLTDNQIERIDVGLTKLSPKEEIENQIADLQSQRTDVFNAKLQNQMRDSVSPDSLIALNINEKGLNARYRLMSVYTAAGDYQNAESVFNSIPSEFQLSEQEQSEYDLMSQFLEIQTSLMSRNQTWFNLSAEQKSTLESLAENGNTLAGTQSRAVLSLVYGNSYFDEIAIPSENPDKSLNHIKTTETKHFTASPNPAKDWFIADYALSENENAADVKIILYNERNEKVLKLSVTNKSDQLLAECGNLKDGIYFLRKTVNNKTEEEIKIEIRKTQYNSSSSDIISADNINKTIFALFPNPASSTVSVVWKTDGTEGSGRDGSRPVRTIEISDISGKIIRTEMLNDSHGIKNLSISDLPKGIYTVSLFVGGKLMKTEKLVVK